MEQQAFIPWLSSDEAILLSEMDPKHKLTDLIYDERLNMPPPVIKIENGAHEIAVANGEEERRQRMTKGQGLAYGEHPPLAGGIHPVGGLAIGEHPPLAGGQDVSGGLHPILVAGATALIPELVKGVSWIVRKIAERKKSHPEGGAVRPGNIAATRGGYNRRLAKWMAKNSPAMIRAEQMATSGGLILPALYRNNRRYLKSVLQMANGLSHPLASALATKYADKLIPGDLVAKIASSAVKGTGGRGMTPDAAHFAGLAKFALGRLGDKLSPAQKKILMDEAIQFAAKGSGVSGGSLKDVIGRFKERGKEFLKGVLPKLLDKGSNLAKVGVNKLIDYATDKIKLSGDTNKMLKDLADKAIGKASRKGQQLLEKGVDVGAEKLAKLAEKGAEKLLEKGKAKVVEKAPTWLQDVVGNKDVELTSLDEPEPSKQPAEGRRPPKADQTLPATRSEIAQQVRDTIGLGRKGIKKKPRGRGMPATYKKRGITVSWL